MNYIIEGEIDFYKELNDTSNINILDDDDICKISHDKLTYNSVKLVDCGHSFNYLPLYNDLTINFNKNRGISCCPYCRTKMSKFMPFIKLDGVTKLYGINSPASKCLPSPKCVLILKSGKNKGKPCNKPCIETEDGKKCYLHNKSPKLHNTTNIIWTVEKEELFKSKTVKELKQMLKSKGLDTNGLKKVLVNKYIINLIH